MGARSETATSAYIRAAMLQLMRNKSYHDISITEICERAGVSRMSFYRHFDSRLEILREHAKQITDEFLRTSGITARHWSRKEFFVLLFTHLQRQKDVALLLSRDDLLFIIKDEMDRVFQLSYAGVYNDYRAYYISGGLYNVFLRWLQTGCRETPEEIAGSLRDILEF